MAKDDKKLHLLIYIENDKFVKHMVLSSSYSNINLVYIEFNFVHIKLVLLDI